jgi:hypothetical protein
MADRHFWCNMRKLWQKKKEKKKKTTGTTTHALFFLLNITPKIN